MTVLREKPPHPWPPQSGAHSPGGNWPLSKTQDTSWLELAVGRAPPGQPGRAGCPGEPSMGLTPKLSQDTPSLAKAQTGSVYRMSALFPLPHPPLPLESWGAGERGRRGLREPRRQPNLRPAPRSPSSSWLLGSIRPRFPVFWFPLQSIGENAHLKREICASQYLLPRKV